MQWVAVPAALAAITLGASGPALATPGHGNHSHSDHAKTEHAKPSRAATTFDKPNHWQAQADPDGMTNGGVDQPGGTGGTIGHQDGNNGSGNDIDCEDDNRGRGVPGHCKDKPAAPKAEHGFAARHRRQATATPHGLHGHAAPHQPGAQSAQPTLPATRPAVPATRPVAAMPTPAQVDQSRPAPGQPAAEVLGISAVRPRTQPQLGTPGQVAGVSAQVQPMAGVLPNTGTPGALVPLGAAGAALAVGGTGLLLRRRRVTS